MKASEKLKKGTKVAYKNGQGVWVESVIEKCTMSSVWFKGMGYSSLRKTTFDNYPELYKVIGE